MINLVKNLRHHIPAVLIIVCLLIVQAYCTLSLPSYTSDIVDVGIEQGGIEDTAAVQIGEETMEYLMMFMDEDAQETVEEAYTLEGGIWYLDEEINDTEEVSDALQTPMVLVYQLSALSEDSFKEMMEEQLSMEEGSLSDMSLEELGAMMGLEPDISEDEDGEVTVNMLSLLQTMQAAGTLDSDTLLSMADEMAGQYGDSGELIFSSVAIQEVSAEYEKIGVDTDQIQRQYLYRIGRRMILMTVLMSVAAILACYFASVTTAKVAKSLREQVFGKVLSFSNSEVDRFSAASLITRCTNDIQQVQMTTVILLRIVLFAPILAIGGIVKVLSSHTGLAWIIVVAALAMTGLIVGLVVIAMPKFKIIQKLIDRVNLVSREILDGVPVIRAFGREKYEEQRFDRANDSLMRVQLFTNRVMSFMMPCMMFVMNGVNLLIIWFGAKGMDDGLMQVGDLVAFMTYALQIIMAFMMIEMISIMMPRTAVAANRVDEVIKTESEIRDGEAASDYEERKFKGELTFDHVTFAYPGASDPVLKDIDFTAKPGTTTAIIGSTGCGKSTLINLIPRFYDVTEGSIQLDGVDIRELSQRKLREQIGLVPQKGFLFSGTIESNIKYSGDSVTDSIMEEAAATAQATEFIDQKNDRYQSEIAQGGTNVSGGQKQRLSIARALAKNAQILIFDDSFSALDYKTDVALRKELAKKSAGATVLIVAQRISTVLYADEILVMNEGRIVGKGTHEELMKSCETYREIARSQLSDQELALNGGAL
ncbi:MAG: ABC transporter ATP-binding protein/permease [Lachnospiraceae bacterium]|nr:ABC transporter ATP-binding protein/permease [Lachnospiraceae bacterium]